MHARPAAKIAGGLAGMEVDVTVNGVDGASMTELMMLGAGKGTVLHIEASGPDAAKALDYLRRPDQGRLRGALAGGLSPEAAARPGPVRPGRR